MELMNPYDFTSPWRRFFRSRRFRGFLERYSACKTIVDMGGDPNLWTELLGRTKDVVVVNLSLTGEYKRLLYVVGDGRRMPFANKSMDLAFSNSAIEHVGSYEDQCRFAEEMMRIGSSVYCQTPCRMFPIDPHLNAFLLHWLPRRWLTPTVLRYCTLTGWLLGKSYVYDVTWISKRKLQALFPGCSIKTERFLGLPKSFVVTL
jgi:hypothetical protein